MCGTLCAAMAKGADTRIALMRAAERLFSKNGVAAVSLREVASEAGQRNVSAVLYHFGTKVELLECVLERHSDPIQKVCAERVNRWQNDASVTMRDVIELLVSELIKKLDDPDGGRAYLALCAQLAASPDFPLTERRAAQAPGAMQLSAKLLSFSAPIPPQVFPLRMMRFANILYLSFADYIRVSNAGFAIPREIFFEELTGALAAVVTGPILAPLSQSHP